MCCPLGAASRQEEEQLSAATPTALHPDRHEKKHFVVSVPATLHPGRQEEQQLFDAAAPVVFSIPAVKRRSIFPSLRCLPSTPSAVKISTCTPPRTPCRPASIPAVKRTSSFPLLPRQPPSIPAATRRSRCPRVTLLRTAAAGRPPPRPSRGVVAALSSATYSRPKYARPPPPRGFPLCRCRRAFLRTAVPRASSPRSTST